MLLSLLGLKAVSHFHPLTAHRKAVIRHAMRVSALLMAADFAISTGGVMVLHFASPEAMEAIGGICGKTGAALGGIAACLDMAA